MKTIPEKRSAFLHKHVKRNQGTSLTDILTVKRERSLILVLTLNHDLFWPWAVMWEMQRSMAGGTEPLDPRSITGYRDWREGRWLGGGGRCGADLWLVRAFCRCLYQDWQLCSSSNRRDTLLKQKAQQDTRRFNLWCDVGKYQTFKPSWFLCLVSCLSNKLNNLKRRLCVWVAHLSPVTMVMRFSDESISERKKVKSFRLNVRFLFKIIHISSPHVFVKS